MDADDVFHPMGVGSRCTRPKKKRIRARTGRYALGYRRNLCRLEFKTNRATVPARSPSRYSWELATSARTLLPVCHVEDTKHQQVVSSRPPPPVPFSCSELVARLVSPRACTCHHTHGGRNSQRQVRRKLTHTTSCCFFMRYGVSCTRCRS